MKKTTFLILTLAIPVCIFLFLKIFGTNTYEVPILFENGIPGCPGSNELFHIPDFKYLNEQNQKGLYNGIGEFTVFCIFNPKDTVKTQQQLVELVRIQDAFYETESPFFILINYGDQTESLKLRSLCSSMGLVPGKSQIISMESADLDSFLTCGLGLIDGDDILLNDLVLADPQKRIRGLYDVFETEETDKLILELKILKKDR